MEKQTILEQAIVSYNQAYREGSPVISDKEYDKLIDQLRAEFPESDLLKTGILEGIPVERKQKLPFRMASLEKVKSSEELEKWTKSIGLLRSDYLIITPKFDGISLLVDETKKMAYTRGDGFFGQRSDDHFKLMLGYGEKNPYITFGEAIMKKGKFTQKYKGKFKSPRNLVSGLFNRIEPTEDLRDVHYLRYGLINSGEMNKSTQIASLNSLNEYKISCSLVQVKDIGVLDFTRIYNEWSKDFQIDGLVIEVDNHLITKRLGREENGNPKYARAYKDPSWSEKHITNVKEIKFAVSKQGKLKPVIVVEPVDIDGVTVTNVTGYNAKYITDHYIAENSEIEIIRSGDVIPKHIRTIHHHFDSYREMCDSLVECPACGEPTTWDNTMTEILCKNENCDGIKISKIEHFMQTVGIEEFGRPSIEQLYNAGYDNVHEIINIKQGELSSLYGWGTKSAKIIFDQFKKLKGGIPLAKLIHAMDWFEGVIGEKTAQMIFDSFSCEENWVDFITSPKNESYKISARSEINGVSSVTAASFLKGYDGWMRYFGQINGIPITYIVSPKKEPVGDKYKGFKVCFTGVRDKALEEEIKSQGGEILSGVSKNTTHLIVKDLSEKTLSSSKAKKAKELGIEIIDLQTFKTK